MSKKDAAEQRAKENWNFTHPNDPWRDSLGTRRALEQDASGSGHPNMGTKARYIREAEQQLAEEELRATTNATRP